MFGRILGSLLALCVVLSSAVSEDQHPLQATTKHSFFPVESHSGDADNILERLKVAEIIPAVLDPFDPQLSISAAWPDNVKAELGNVLDPSDTQKAPNVHFADLPSTVMNLSSVQLTLAMTDPDAPSRDDPKWSEMAHWVTTNVPLKGAATSRSKLEDVMEYKPPGPPPKTGKHRYVFAALMPKNGTMEGLNLSKPGDRKHWGYPDERQGLRKWADENGLTVVGANFVYEQNREQ